MARPEKKNQPDITQFVADTFESPVDLKRHDVPERHAFGESFLAPADTDVAPVGPAPQTGSAGVSEKFSRADHRHEFAGAGSGGGVTDHGQLLGLTDDDHPQYTLTAEATSIANVAVVTHVGLADPHTQYLTSADIVSTLSFVHNQGSPSAVWTITHNLGWFPNVIVIDSGGTEVEGDVTQVSATQLRINFSGAFTGVAYLS